jgi:hypothetical protein
MCGLPITDTPLVVSQCVHTGNPVAQYPVSHMNWSAYGAVAAGQRPPMNGGTLGVSYGQDPYNGRYSDSYVSVNRLSPIEQLN